MTKDQEIARFRKFLESLPAKSTYTGEWLRGQVDAIEGAIRSDLLPDGAVLSAEDFWKKRVKAINQAEHEAGLILAKAKRDAEFLVVTARKDATAIRQRTKRFLLEAVAEIPD